MLNNDEDIVNNNKKREFDITYFGDVLVFNLFIFFLIKKRTNPPVPNGTFGQEKSRLTIKS
ncbi:MAG: hypothetical protein AAF934_05705 [Bacteroidota bacterium]